MEMFDLRGNELKYAKELLLNHYRKSVQNSVRLQKMWVELKLYKSRITYAKCFEVVFTRQQNAILQPGYILINQLKPILDAFRNLLQLGQVTIC